MRHCLLFFFFLFFFWANGFSENPPFNPLTVEAGDDLIICAPGQMVTLNGSVGGVYSSVIWDPAAGMSDPTSLTPNVFVSSTTTFTLTANGQGATTNIITNGDFEAGASGFWSEYIPGTGGPWGLLSNEGEYAVDTDPANTHTNWPPCGDHTTGTGNMMIVNGSSVAGENVWCQIVPVDPNTVYEFSAWLTSVHPSSPAVLQFSINGNLLGSPFGLSGATCNWNNFFETWDSGGNATAEICIVNQNTASSGNDFAIDDISFGPVCSESDEVTVTVVDVSAFAVPTAVIPCNNSGAGIILDGSGSTTGPDVTYLWTTGNGNIVSGETTLMPTVNAPGLYELTVSLESSLGPCTASTFVEVVEDVPPDAFATTGNDINCINTTGTVLGTGSTVGPNIVYQWTTPDGFIVSGENDIIAEVGAAGTYILLVTDLASGCTDEAATMVEADMELPTAEAAPDGNLDCNNIIVVIDGSGSSGGANLSYQWTTTNGNIVSNPALDTIEVDEAGDYELTVTNDDNGCIDVTAVQIDIDSLPPEIEIETPAPLDCNTTNFMLDASASGSDSLLFVWTTNDGNIVSGDSTSMPEIDQVGTYVLVLIDSVNGCSSTDSVLVTGNVTPPSIAIAAPNQLTCATHEITLDATGSQAGVNFSWSTPGGNIVSGENTAEPTVDQTGNYILVITDPVNGCTSVDSVEVEADQSLPIAEAGAVATLDCNTTSVNLDGTGSSSGADISYLWTTVDGNILNGATTLTPEINSGGTYVLTVTNNATGCESSDNVAIPQNNDLPTAVASAPNELNCNNLTLTIDGTSSSSGANYSILWTTVDGNILSGETTLEPVVDAEGTYVLTITNLTSTCTATDEVVVVENFTSPVADAGTTATLTCTSDTLQLDGSASIFSNNANVLWTTSDGEFAEGENTLAPTITEPGTYILTITNTESGCTDQAEVVIDENITTPEADAGTPMELTCTITSLQLDGIGSSQSGNFTYLWTTQNGNIVNGEMTLTPTVDAAGNYLLLVIDNDNGCENTSGVEVTLNGDFPMADAGITTELTCAITEATLNGSGDIGSEFVYAWTTSDGQIISGDSTLTPEIGASGTYTLTVTNTDNGCTTTDDVFIAENTNPPSVNAGPTDELSCTQTELNLNGSGNAPGNDISYSWTTPDGNVLSGENTPSPLVNAAGTYWLTITDNLNGCIDSASVIITQDANVPVANAGVSALLTCNVTTLQLDGSGSSSNPDITYEWTTVEGNILNGESTLFPEIDAPGTYLLTVTDVANDCEAISSVLITENTMPPAANAGPDGLLTCSDTQVILDGSASANGAEFIYEWSTQNGNILSGNDTNAPTVDAAGIYQILVTNTLTGCTNTATVAVDEDITPPTVLIENPDVITCEFLEIALDASNSSSGSFTYQWTTLNGNIVAGENTISPMVNEDGEYNLLITNTFNGCTADAAVLVSEDKELPTADAGQTMEINCYSPTINLDGSGSSTGTDLQYQWATLNGNIISGATSLAPEINAAGTYTLIVLDQSNGCESEAEVSVTEDVETPNFNFIPPGILTCTETQITIDASGSSSGSDFEYSWSTPNGNMISGHHTLQLTVDEPGDYTLMILNNENGCDDEMSVSVEEDVDLPVVDAGPTFEFNCQVTQGNLAGSTDVANGFFDASWTTMNGQIDAGQYSLSPIISEPGIYQLTITNLENGCSETDEVTITENIFEDFNFSTQDPTCLSPSGTVEFTGVQGGAVPYSYSINNGQSFSSNPVFPLPAGVYDLVIQDANGCELTDVALLSDPPEIEVFLEAQVVLQLGDSYQLNALTSIPESEIETVEWTPTDFLSCDDCLNPVATPIQQTIYKVTITSKDGCTAEANTAVFLRKNLDIYVPNAFSPNGDGINDIFHIYAGGNGIAQINSFKIFSRWGESVFEYYDFPPNDPQYGWNGKYRNEPMNPAVFVWFAEVELIDGTKKLIEGDVHLMR